VNFAGLTGDFNPLHMDHEFARQSHFGRPIAHGILGLSLVAGLGSHWPRVRTDAFISIQNWKFLKPVYFGDTVHVLTEVVEKGPRGRRRGNVCWRRQLINQHGDVVQEGIFETLVSSMSQVQRAPHVNAPPTPSPVAPASATEFAQ
jgi:acyl dehydratase